MNYTDINWPELQVKQPPLWRTELPRRTIEVLSGSGDVYLAKHNEAGYFHNVFDAQYYGQMKDDWEALGKVPPEWILKGNRPGIWTAMFHPCNTCSRWENPLLIVRFYFKEGYKIFDRENETHQQLEQSWVGSNPNPWKDALNSHGRSLEQRLGSLFVSPPVSSHKKFYEDHKFGAIIGYSDYISAVILLEDAVEKVEFFEYFG